MSIVKSDGVRSEGKISDLSGISEIETGTGFELPNFTLPNLPIKPEEYVTFLPDI